MADGIEKTISDILRAIRAGKDLNEVIKDLDKAGEIAPGVSNAAIANIKKYQKALKDLQKSQKELKEVQDLIAEKDKKKIATTEEEIKLLQEKEEAFEQSKNTIVNAAEKMTRAHRENEEALADATERAMQNWKANTVLGKGYGLASSQVAKFAAGLGLGAAALKAYSSVTDAARVKQDILIQSYKGAREGTIEAVKSTMSFESAMRDARATAISLGMSADEVSGLMVKFANITGSKNPEALGNLSKASLALSKSLGITTAETLSYVEQSMNKFGGSATGALSALDALGDEARRYNTEMRGMKMRGDDVIHTINDIASNSNVYAVDQRYLSNLIMRTSGSLQAQGESYDYAQKRASEYTKALTTEAPRWMKIVAGQEISKTLGQSLDPEAAKLGITKLTAEMEDQLESAKPGLSKKVTDILGDKTMSQFAKNQVLQQILGETEVGMDIMNKTMLKTFAANGQKNVEGMAAVYGISESAAYDMLEAAEKQEEVQKRLNALKTLSGKQLDDEYTKMQLALNLTDEGINKAKTDVAYRKTIVELYQQEQDINQKALETKRSKDEIVKERKAALTARIENYKADIASGKGMKGMLEREIQKAQRQLDQMEGRGSDEKAANIERAQEIAKKGFEDVGGTTAEVMTGRYIDSMKEAFSGPLQVLGAGLGLKLLYMTGVQNKIEGWAKKIALEGIPGYKGSPGPSTGGGPGDGGPDAGESFGNSKTRGSDRFKERVKRSRSRTRAGRMLNRMSAMRDKASSLYNKVSNSKMLRWGKKLPLLGKALGAASLVGDVSSAFASDGVSGAAKTLVKGGSGLAGGAAGTAIGAAIGSVLLPGIGTAVGGFLGNMAGDAIGEYIGDAAASRVNGTKMSTTVANTVSALAPASQVQQAASGAATSTSQLGPVTTTEGMPEGEFGPMNPDGSMNITIKNAMTYFASAQSMANRTRPRR